MSYRSFAVTVARRTQLTPHLVRITFTGPDLDRFGDTCLDQRIKVVLPIGPESSLDSFPGGPEWYAQWRLLPAAEQHPIRTYTVRQVRQPVREVDIDFVDHGAHGPAGVWLATATTGTRSILIGPDATVPASRTAGVEWKPGAATHFLIAGDETAVPAIANIVASLDPGAVGEVLIEVPAPEDAFALGEPAGVTVRWLARGDAEPGSQLLQSVPQSAFARPEPVRATEPGSSDSQVIDPAGEVDSTEEVDEDIWEVPEAPAGTRYAWLAGESTAITALRRVLVKELHWDKKEVAFMGYWRLGVSL